MKTNSERIEQKTNSIKSFHEKQQETYKNLAMTFDQDQQRDNRNHFNKIAAINNHLDIQPGDNVLEIGIGTGIHAGYLLDFNKNIDFHCCPK